VESVASADPVNQVASAESAALVDLVSLAVSVESAALVGLVSPAVSVELVVHGSIILRIAAEHHMATAARQTSSAVRRAAILFRTAKAVRAIKLGDQAATSQARVEILAATLAAAEILAAV